MTMSTPLAADPRTGQSLWSCTTCKQRKIRCDRNIPCSQCVAKGRDDCTFPVYNRTRHDIGPAYRNLRTHDALRERVAVLEARLESVLRQQALRNNDGIQGDSAGLLTDGLDGDGGVDAITTGAGKLFVGDASSLYLGVPMWASLCNAEGDDGAGPCQELSRTWQSYHSNDNAWPFFALGRRSGSEAPRPFLYLSKLPLLWKRYVECVDPLMKILHAPCMSESVRDFENTDGNWDYPPPLETLMYAICLAAVTTMTEEEVTSIFNVEKHIVFEQLKSGTEYALRRAGFPDTSNISVLQAATIYVVAVAAGHVASQREMWSFLGLLTRLAVSIGLHRDPSDFPNLRPFECEMRRRLFWAICLIDWQTGDTQFIDLSTYDLAFDTKLPRNVDDDKIFPSMQELPPSDEGVTDMSVFLLWCRFWRLNQRLHIINTKVHPQKRLGLDAQLKALREAGVYFREHYLAPLESSRDVHRFATKMAEFMLLKGTVRLHFSSNRLFNDEEDILFNNSVALLEQSSGTLPDSITGPAWRKWSWLPLSIISWHPIAAVLHHLGESAQKKTWSTTHDSAWEIVQKAISNIPLSARNGPYYLTICRLVQKVETARRDNTETDAASQMRADNGAYSFFDDQPFSMTGLAGFQMPMANVQGLIAHSDSSRPPAGSFVSRLNACAHDTAGENGSQAASHEHLDLRESSSGDRTVVGDGPRLAPLNNSHITGFNDTFAPVMAPWMNFDWETDLRLFDED